MFSVLDIVCREAVASFFYPSVNAIVDAVHAQKAQADVPINVLSFSVIVATAHYFWFEDYHFGWRLRGQ
jgi:hypothetical protein